MLWPTAHQRANPPIDFQGRQDKDDKCHDVESQYKDQLDRVGVDNRIADAQHKRRHQKDTHPGLDKAAIDADSEEQKQKQRIQAAPCAPPTFLAAISSD